MRRERPPETSGKTLSLSKISIIFMKSYIYRFKLGVYASACLFCLECNQACCGSEGLLLVQADIHNGTVASG